MGTSASSDIPSTRRETTYERYLRTRDLLALQKPSSERLHPDELVFQVVHQTFELWWKTTVELLQRAGDHLDRAEAGDAAICLRRAVEAQSVVMLAMRQLEFVPPADFLIIRGGLGDGSGTDSPGFRAILRSAPALWEAFSRMLERTGVSLVALYREPRAHPDLYACAEELTDFDEQFQIFRTAHLKLAQRHLGPHAVGTGGVPLSALERTLRDALFPPLWAARDELLAEASAGTRE